MFPNMSDVLNGMGKRVQFAVVSKTAVDFEAVETLADAVWFTASLQPIKAWELQFKPEGQRQWKWFTMFTTKDIALDYIIQDRDCKQFRVVEKKDWNGAGFTEYQIYEWAKT